MDMPRSRYSIILRTAHWLTVIAIIAAYVLAEVEEDFPEHSPSRALSEQGHYLAGLAVLALLVPRILSRLRTPAPPIVPPPSALLAALARIVHLSLYGFLLLEPILGVLQVNYGGELVTLPWIGWSLPPVVGANHQAHEVLGEIHEVLGNVFYAVIGAHIAAALWHHFVSHDNTLRRMI